jgi:CheY-like chemotaxis protein
MALHPDLIVLDLAMPYVDGWQAAERLRRSPVTRSIPIIALTAIPGARESARLSGCDAFMSKPCLPQLLWCEVRLLLGIDDVRAASTADDEEHEVEQKKALPS